MIRIQPLIEVSNNRYIFCIFLDPFQAPVMLPSYDTFTKYLLHLTHFSDLFRVLSCATYCINVLGLSLKHQAPQHCSRLHLENSRASLTVRTEACLTMELKRIQKVKNALHHPPMWLKPVFSRSSFFFTKLLTHPTRCLKETNTFLCIFCRKKYLKTPSDRHPAFCGWVNGLAPALLGYGKTPKLWLEDGKRK